MTSPFFKVLSNGLPIIINRVRGARSVEIALYVKAGPMFERGLQTGISHFIEHILLKGPIGFDNSRKFHETLEYNGITADALTKEEYTFYSYECHPRDLECALDLFYSMIAGPRFAAADIIREKQVIAEEYHSFMDENKLGNKVFDLIYPAHKAHFNLIGKLHSIRRFSRGNIVSYYKKHYTAKNMILCIAGNVNPHRLFSLIKKTWTHIPSGGSLYLKNIKPSGKRRRAMIQKPDSPQIEFSLVFPAYSWNDKRVYPLRYLSRIAGESPSSRLFVKVREEMGLAYDIGTSIYCLSGCGVFDTHAICSPDKLIDIVNLIWDELKQLSRTQPTESEFISAQKALRNHVAFSRNNLAFVNDYFGLYNLLGKKRGFPSFGSEIRRISSIKPAEMLKIAAEIFTPGNLHFVATGPFDSSLKKSIKKVLKKLS